MATVNPPRQTGVRGPKQSAGHARRLALLIAALGALCTSGALAFMAAERPDSPDLTIEPAVVNLGQVEQNERYVQRFQFR